MSPEDVATRLRDLRAPEEDAAAERAWVQVREALDAGPLAEPASPGRRFLRRPRLAARRSSPLGRPSFAGRRSSPLGRASFAGRRSSPLGRPPIAARLGHLPAVGVALAVLAVLAVGAFTPPGEAVAEWLRRAVDRPASAPKPVPGPLALPAGGAVLVQAPGGLWIVDADGDRHRLGRWDDAAWSASGRFVAAVHGQRLAALDRRGHVRWSLTRPFQLAQPAWSPDGFHVAYRSANGLRVVAGDGSGDRFLAGGLGPAGAAWQPGPRAIVIWADRRGRVHAADADSARELWVGAPGPAVRLLRWSGDGARLAAVSGRSLRLYDGRGRLLRRTRLPDGTAVDAATFARQGKQLALVLHDARRGFSQVVTTGAGALHPLFGGRGRIATLAYSPLGGWLMVAWRGADEWVFLRAPDADRVKAVGDVTRRVDPRLRSYPRVLGWCCPP
jgi:hypothetical protein